LKIAALSSTPKLFFLYYIFQYSNTIENELRCFSSNKILTAEIKGVRRV